MGPIRTLFAIPSAKPSEVVLPEGLRSRYDGNLSFPPAPEERPYCIANFVSTLDGVASFNMPGQSEGAQISKSNEEDRFIMGLLRASADAVLVGSGALASVEVKALSNAEKDISPSAILTLLKRDAGVELLLRSGSDTLWRISCRRAHG